MSSSRSGSSQRAFGQQGVGLALRYGEDDGVRVAAARRRPDLHDAPARRRPARVMARDAGAQFGAYAGRVERLAGEGVVQVARAGRAAQPMSAAPGSESSPVLKTMAARPSEASAARALRVATPTRSHRASIGARRLAVPAQPGARSRCRPAPGRPGRASSARARRGRPRPARRARGADSAARSGGQVQRYGQGVAAQPCRAGAASGARRRGPARPAGPAAGRDRRRRSGRGTSGRRCSSAGTRAGRCRR